jgi:single-stranded DNA-binding protein
VIEALVSGKVFGVPVQRISKAGRPFVTGKMRIATGNGESAFIGLVAFSDSATAALSALSDGDGCSVAGTLTVGAFMHKDGTPRPALDLVAHLVLTAYHLGRKRKAMLPPDTSQERDEQLPGDEPSNTAPAPHSPREPELNDALPF